MKSIKKVYIAAGLIMIILLTLLIIFRSKREISKYDCKDEIGCVVINPHEPVKLGVIQDLSGGASVFGKVQLNCILLALEHRNNQVLGHPIKLQIEDEQCSAAGGKNTAYKIISDPQVVAVLGTTCSAAAAVASKIISDKGLILLSGLNSAPSLTAINHIKGENWHPGFFRTSSNDAFRGIAAARFAYSELGIKKAATIDDGDTYTRGIAEIFSREFIRLGGEITLNAKVDKGDSDMKPVLTAIANTKARLLFFDLFANEGIRVIRQIKKMPNLKHLKMLGGIPLLVPKVFKSIGLDGVGMYFVSSTMPEGLEYEKLITAYKDKYNQVPAGRGCSTVYDGVNILLNAIEKVAIQDKNKTIYIGRQALRDALYATKKYKGITGLLNCDKFGDCGFPKFRILQSVCASGREQDIKKKTVYIYEPEKK